MNKTYHGRTAGGILKTARAKLMRAGNAEILVTLPNGADCCARLIERPDGWGGTVRDALLIFDACGTVATLALSSLSIKKMMALENQAAQMTKGPKWD